MVSKIYSFIALNLVMLCFIQTVSAQNKTPATLFSWHGQPVVPDSMGPLVADRPDFTEAASTVGVGFIQLESGYTFTKNTYGNNTIIHSLGEPLLRVGLWVNWLEFRLAMSPLFQLTDYGNDFGVTDSYIGFKIALAAQNRFIPQITVIPQMTVPTGTSDFTDGEILPGMNFVYGWQITDSLSVFANTQFHYAIDDNGNSYYSWAQSVSGSLALTDQISAYMEWYTIFPQHHTQVKVEHYLNGGFTYLFTNDIQFDIRAGAGLTEVSDNFFAGLGVALRFQILESTE